MAATATVSPVAAHHYMRSIQSSFSAHHALPHPHSLSHPHAHHHGLQLNVSHHQPQVQMQQGGRQSSAFGGVGFGAQQQQMQQLQLQQLQQIQHGGQQHQLYQHQYQQRMPLSYPSNSSSSPRVPAHGRQYQRVPQTQTMSISTHNAHMYAHHLRGLSSQSQTSTTSNTGSLAGAKRAPSPTSVASEKQQYPMTRKRSSSIRGGVPPGVAMRGREVNVRTVAPATMTAYKFDPFADDEDVTVAAASENEGNMKAPYTIHIPAARDSEIQQYAVGVSAPAPVPALQSPSQPPIITSRPLSPRAAEFTPSRSPSPPKSLSPPPKQVQQPIVQARPMPTPNLSKIVAGILLNRVHAVGKPMRRRVYSMGGGCAEEGVKYRGANVGAGGERKYVKSCLSRVVSVGVEC